MRLISFLTFVLFFSCLAGPVGAAPNSEIGATRPSIKPQDDDSVQSATLLRSRSNSRTVRTVGLGWMSGNLVDKDQNRSTNFLSLTQTNPNVDLTSQNFGFEATELGLVGAHWGFRNLLTLGEWFEPYYQYGVGALYKSQEGLATFINYERYQARASVGFEDFFHLRRQLRFDVTVAYSPLGLSYQAGLSYNPSAWLRW